MKSLHSVGSRMHSSWAAAASDPSEECMVTVSTLERQHMASWSGTTTSNRATLSRGSHKRPGTDPSHNGHPPTNSTEKREHCKCQSSWGCICVHIAHNGCNLMQFLQSEVICRFYWNSFYIFINEFYSFILIYPAWQRITEKPCNLLIKETIIKLHFQ